MIYFINQSKGARLKIGSFHFRLLLKLRLCLSILHPLDYFKMKKKRTKKTDTLRKGKSVLTTLSHPMISIGTEDLKVLRNLLNTKDKRFNVRRYSIINKIARSSVYESLNRLEKIEFVDRKLANNKITKKGEVYLESTNRGVGSSRGECRKDTNLSTHYHSFKLKISNKEKFRKERLERLDHEGLKENKLPNLHQIIVDFQDAKILINPKQVIIRLFEVISEDVEQSDINSLSRALEYAEMLRKIGLETEGMMVEDGHWARVESILSDFLFEKVDKRYFLTLENGERFWIDHSEGKREDETDNKLVRERVDNFLNQISNRDLDLDDIDKIKSSLGFITKLETARLTDKIEENKLKRLQLKKIEEKKELKLDYIPSYLG